VRTALAAWLAAVLAAMTVFPLVQGLGWFVDVVLLAALTGGAGLAVRRLTTSGPVVVAVQLVVWIVAVCMIFLNRTAVLGVLPGPEAVTSAQELLQQGLRVMRRSAAPVPATAGVVFVTAAGLSLVALAVDVLAVTVRRPAVAGLPLLAVYCVPAAVLRDGLSWPLFLVAGAGFLVLVAVDSVDRVQAWGRVLSGAGSASRSGLGMVFAGARRLAGVSLAVAVLLPLVVPGLGDRVLGSGSGTGRGPGNGTVTVLNPLLNLRADLADRSNAPLLTYTTTLQAPQPLRVVVDDEFRGDLWQPSAGEVPRENKVQSGAPLPQGLSESVQRTAQTTTIQVGTLAQNYLPLPFPWSKVDVDGDWIFDGQSLVAVGEGTTTQGLQYTVDHYTVEADPSALRSAPEPDPAVFARYTQLPENFPGEIKRQAALNAGVGTKYEQMIRLRNWLRTFTYSEQAPGNGTNDSGTSSLLQFLEQKSGYCVHFASALAVMARALEVPSRVVVGFLPGTKGPDGRTWTVSLRDAHAWPELYFQGFGWVRFEPTPPARTSNAPDQVPPGDEGLSDPSASPSVSEANPSPSSSANIRAPGEDEAAVDAAAAQAGPASIGERLVGVLRSPFTLVVLVALAVLAVPGTVLTLARRRRWRRATSRNRRAEAALDELGERLSDFGLPLSAATTPRGLRQWLVGAEYVPPDRAEPLDRIVRELEGARYAPPGGEGPGAQQLRDDVRSVAHLVGEQVPASRRRLVRLLPPSGIALVTGAARRADLMVEGAGERAAGQVGREVRKLVGQGRR
jgi:transglutaminase-like putative cysteine protease